MEKFYQCALFVLALFFISPTVHAQRKMEKLGRGVVATRSSTNAIFVSWRLLGTEPQDIGFNIYRSANGGNAVKLNSSVLLEGTNWMDISATASQANTYFVKSVINNIEQAASEAYTLPANTPVQPFLKVPINHTPGYSVRYIWVGDLDGDGEYDFVFDKHPDNGADVILLEAYKRDGTFLWQMNCGPNSLDRYNISPGSSTLNIGHGDNITVYDLNGDGKAEVIVRTANGVKFQDGSTVTDASNDKQFISVLNGMTGAEISRTPYNNPNLSRGPMNGHMGVAYLDGINPSIVWEAKNRNADESFSEYTTAWDWKNGTLVQRWQYLSTGGEESGPQMSGHQIRTVDVDGDGKDEIIPQGFTIDDNGTLLYSLGDNDIFHGDRFQVGDLDPSRPGLEVYGIQQGYSTTGIMWYYCDAKTGKVLLTQKDPANRDLGRGMAGDFDPRYPGYEFYTFVDGIYNVSGAKTSAKLPSSYPNMRLWWDGDLGSENLDGVKFTKWNHLTESEDRIYTARDVLTVGPSVPGFYGDILGDWREEVVYESSDHKSLVIYTTPIHTTHRIYTLPHNPAYRNSMTVKGYYQSNMPDFYLGYDMEQPPMPNIQTANKYWEGTSLVWDTNSSNWTNGNTASAFANGDTVMFDIRGNNTDTIKLNTNLSPAKIWAMNPQGKDYNIAGSGKLTGAMELIKAQAGTISISGNHDYTGKTEISEGTLSFNGSVESPIIIQPKGNLGGNALLNGGLTLKSGLTAEGGRISPGNGNSANLLGTLTIQGNLMVPGKNNFAFDIVPGSGKINDSLIVKGNLTVNGTNKLIINFLNELPVPGIYTLIACTGTLTATAGNFTIEGFVGVPKELIIENNQIKLKILSQRAPGIITWKGTQDNVWSFEKTNFELNSTPAAFVSNDVILFDETALKKSINLTETAFTKGLTFNALGDYSIDGTGSISGDGDLIKSNTNKLSILSNNNTYTGKTIINGGTLEVSTIGSAGEPSSLGSAGVSPENLQINNSSLIINNFCTTNRGMTIGGNMSLSVPTANSYAIFVGEITGSGSLTKEGTGSIYLVNKNTYTGPTFIKSGTVNLRSSVGNESGLGASGTVTIENATLNMDDARGNAQIRWNIIVPEGKTATVNTDGRSALLGTLTGSGTLNVKTPYVRTDFKGDWSAFTGKINISGSDFRIGNNKGYANASLNLTEGTMYTISGSNNAAAIGELSGLAKTTLTTAAWTVGSKNTDAVFAGNILGNSVTKVGTGTWTLTGNNTYTGATDVNAGRLLVNSSLIRGAGSGIVTVATGAAIGGTGSIKGALVLNSGATLEPGSNGIGTLTDSTSVTLSAGAITVMEVNRTAKNNDLLKVVGALSLNGKLSVVSLNNAAFALGDSFKLFDATTIQGGFSSIEPAIPGEGLAWSFSNTSGILSVIMDPSAVFTLPAKNFRLSVTDETCNTSNNGKINISATEPLDYTAVVNGNNNSPYVFTAANPLEIVNLSAGSYAVCITVNGKPGYKQCFDMVVSEPPALSVYSSINTTDKTVSLSLSGSENYSIALNGRKFNARSGAITLDLLPGKNSLIVTTDKECQGSFERSIFLDDKTLIYPNPFENILNINIGNDPSKRAGVNVYALNGARVYTREHTIANNEIAIDLSSLVPGNYIIKIKTDSSETTSNIIKK